MGIRGQLAIVVPGLVALAGIGLGVMLGESHRRDEIEQMRSRSEGVLGTVGITVAVHVAQNDMGALDTLIAHVSEAERFPDLRELAVLDARGRILAHTRPELFNSLARDDFSVAATLSDRPIARREGQLLRVAVPAESGLRWATVTASFSLDRLERSLALTRRRWVLTGAGLVTGLALLLYAVLDRLVVRPLRVLQHVTRRMAEGNLGARVPPAGSQELAELGEAFNRMASALAAQTENLERAVADRTRELAEANVRLERLAVTDGLTGLFNHRRFHEALGQEVVRASRKAVPVSVLMIDVDYFKRFNDAAGHPAGDELLRRMAAALGSELRAMDLLARYGGEEFAAILPEADQAEAFRVGQRLRAAVNTLGMRAGVDEPPVSISVGVATLGPDGGTPSELLEQADRALYAAKRAGRDRVVSAGSPP